MGRSAQGQTHPCCSSPDGIWADYSEFLLCSSSITAGPPQQAPQQLQRTPPHQHWQLAPTTSCCWRPAQAVGGQPPAAGAGQGTEPVARRLFCGREAQPQWGQLHAPAPQPEGTCLTARVKSKPHLVTHGPAVSPSFRPLSVLVPHQGQGLEPVQGTSRGACQNNRQAHY